MNSEVETLTYRRNPFQKRVKLALETNKKNIVIFAGWRTGKTDFVSIEHVIRRQAYQNPDTLHLIAANTYSQVNDSTLRSLFAKLKWLGIPHVPDELPKTHRPFSLFIHNGDKWVEFLIRSMDNFDTIAGVTLGSYWLDEVWATERWTWELANSRLSDKESKLLQGVLTTTKDDLESWMYTDVVETLTQNRAGDDGTKPSDYIEIVEGTTYDNQKNLVDGYIEMQKAVLDSRMFDRYILNKWVNISSGKMFYNFDRDLHLRKTELDEHLPLRISSDFNVDPMSWTLWQMSGERLKCFDEIVIHGNADTEITCKEVWNRYEQHLKNIPQIIWYGDASGRSNSTKSNRSDYEIIKQFFSGKGIEIDLRVPYANPAIRDSANAVNARLKNARNEVNIEFDKEKVPNTVLSVEGMTYKTGTHEKDDSKDKNPNSRVKTHLGDTVRYIANREFPLKRGSQIGQSR